MYLFIYWRVCLNTCFCHKNSEKKLYSSGPFISNNAYQYFFFCLQNLKDNLTIAYEKLDIFRSPLYMALSYEENQGPLHSLLAQVLWDISTDVNASSVLISSEVTNIARNFTVLKEKKIIEKIMNSFPRLTDSWIAKVLTKVKNETPEKNLVPLIICSLEPPLLFLRHLIPFLYMTNMPNIQV